MFDTLPKTDSRTGINTFEKSTNGHITVSSLIHSFIKQSAVTASEV